MDQLAMRIVEYIAWRTGCIHPFRASRLLILASWRASEKGLSTPSFRVEGFEAGFYIDGFKEALENSGCFKVNEEKHCMEYTCNPPRLSQGLREIVDEVLEEYGGLSDIELNRRVVRDPRYKELLARGGFH